MTEHRLKVQAEKIMKFPNFIHKSLNNEIFDGYIQARRVTRTKKFMQTSYRTSYRGPYPAVKNVRETLETRQLRKDRKSS